MVSDIYFCRTNLHIFISELERVLLVLKDHVELEGFENIYVYEHVKDVIADNGIRVISITSLF